MHMKQKDISAGQTLSGVEPGQSVRVVAAIPKDFGALHLIYRTEDANVRERVILKKQSGGIIPVTMARRFSLWNINAASIKHMRVSPNRQHNNDSLEAEFHWISTVILAGIWLIENDWGNMRFMPYEAAIGAWRCEFHLRGHPEAPLFCYSSASRGEYLAWGRKGSIAADAMPPELGRAIAATIPEPERASCRGEAPTDLRHWLDELKAHLSAGKIPLAFNNDYLDNTDPEQQWKLFTLIGLPGSGKVQMIRPMPGFTNPWK